VISLAAGRQRELITGFAQRWKGVELDFIEGSREEILERLRYRHLDVIFLPGPREVTDAIMLPLWTERFYIVVPEGHPLVGRSRIKWFDFAGEPLILRAYESAAEIQAFLISKLGSDADRLTVRQLSVSRESLINLVGVGDRAALGRVALSGPGPLPFTAWRRPRW
jgi:DNA-binding transcriptional LysR family regulator